MLPPTANGKQKHKDGVSVLRLMVVRRFYMEAIAGRNLSANVIVLQVVAYFSNRSHSQRHAVSTVISLPLVNLINSVPSS
ncbi:hypothetical protein H6G77_28110 [Aulosira sp. FACHB-615]|nr:hypothetical protein [Aulosira sp. FACHB-615]